MSLFHRLPPEIIMMILERLPDLLTCNKLLYADEIVAAVYKDYSEHEVERADQSTPKTRWRIMSRLLD